MLDLKSRLYRVRPKLSNDVDILDASGYVKRFVKFVQHKVAEIVPLVLLWLIVPWNPDVAPRKLAQANQPPLHFVVLRRHTFYVFVNPLTHCPDPSIARTCGSSVAGEAGV